MSQFIFELAQKSDDSALQKILFENPIEGEIELAFQRKRGYFHALGIEGKFNQVIIARERLTKEIVGFGTRSIRPAYINGEIIEIGYLNHLRLNKAYRGKTLLAKGYQFLKTLHQDKKVSIYITTIAENNVYAKKLLTEQRAGLPAYNDFGIYHSIAILFSRKKKKLSNNFKIIRGSKERLDEILECIQRNGSQKQFYPFYTKEDFILDVNILRDFKIENFYLAIKNNKVIGVMAKWDQNNFKQFIVTSYNGRMKLFRPFYDLSAKILGYSPLPSRNSQLNFFYVCFIAVDFNDLEIFQELLRSIYNDAVASPYSFFLVGLHSRDPLFEAMKEYHYILYKSRLYIVCWEDGESLLKSLDNRTPYLEISIL